MARAKLIGDIPRLPIQLELSPEEYEALFLVLRSVGGSPTGPRSLIDGIRKTIVAVVSEDEEVWADTLNRASGVRTVGSVDLRRDD